jgi:hypothetical protein
MSAFLNSHLDFFIDISNVKVGDGGSGREERVYFSVLISRGLFIEFQCVLQPSCKVGA